MRDPVVLDDRFLDLEARSSSISGSSAGSLACASPGVAAPKCSCSAERWVGVIAA
jgi:hypothetical protein